VDPASNSNPLTPAFCQAVVQGARQRPLRLPSCAYPTNPSLACTCNAIVSTFLIVLACIDTCSFSGLAGLAPPSCTREPHSAALARALAHIESASKRGQPPRHLRHRPAPYHTQSAHPWLLNPHNRSALGRPAITTLRPTTTSILLARSFGLPKLGRVVSGCCHNAVLYSSSYRFSLLTPTQEGNHPWYHTDSAAIRDRPLGDLWPY
jgi:hypothetical protein